MPNDELSAKNLTLPETWAQRLWEMEGAVCKFRTSLPLIPNTTQYPNFILDWLLALLTPEEYKVLSYIVRHTLGFQKPDDDIAISQFTDGIIKENGERFDCGTGLSSGAIRRALTFLSDELGLIIVSKGGPRAAHFYLNDGQDPRYPLNLAALIERAAKWEAKFGAAMTARAAHARAKRTERIREQQPELVTPLQSGEDCNAVTSKIVMVKQPSVLPRNNTKPTLNPPTKPTNIYRAASKSKSSFPPVAAPRASKPAKQPREPRAPREPDAPTAAALERLAETESVVAPYREAFLGAYGVAAGDMPREDLAKMAEPILTFLGFASKPGAQDLAACALYHKALWEADGFSPNNALVALRLVVKGYASWARERPGTEMVRQRQARRPGRPQAIDRKTGDARHYGGTPEDRARIKANIDPHEWDWLKTENQAQGVGT